MNLEQGTRIQQDAQKQLRDTRRGLLNDEYARQSTAADKAAAGFSGLLNKFAGVNQTAQTRSAAMKGGFQGMVDKVAAPAAPTGGAVQTAANAQAAQRAMTAGNYIADTQGFADALSRIVQSGRSDERQMADAKSEGARSMSLLGNDLVSASNETSKALNFGELVRQLSFGQRGAALAGEVGNIERAKASQEQARQQALLDQQRQAEAEQNRLLLEQLRGLQDLYAQAGG